MAALALLGASDTAEIDRGGFGPFMRSLNQREWGYRVVPDPTGAAPVPVIERFEVRPGDCFSNSGWNDCVQDRERSELSERYKRTGAGSEYWYGWSIHIPEDYPIVYPTKACLGQFHQHEGKVIWMFQNHDGGLYLDPQIVGGSHKNYFPLIEGDQFRGQWHRVEVHVLWTRGDNGFFRVYVNGEQKVNYRGQTMTAQKVYFKYGVYRSFVSRYRNANNVTEVPAQIVYYANVRRSSAREGLLP